jgi:hypothetical protein
MKKKLIYFLITVIFFLSCRETIGDQPSDIDIEMEKRIIGNWIFDNGEPPDFDSTILFFNFSNEMSLINYSTHDTFDYRYIIRDSVLTFISFSSYPNRLEVDFQIDFLDPFFLTISRYQNLSLINITTFRKFYAYSSSGN